MVVQAREDGGGGFRLFGRVEVVTRVMSWVDFAGALCLSMHGRRREVKGDSVVLISSVRRKEWSLTETGKTCGRTEQVWGKMKHPTSDTLDLRCL